MKGSEQALPRPDVLFSALPDEEGVLLDLRTMHSFRLNTSGCRIWQLLSAGEALAAVVQALQTEFDVAEEQAKQSVADLLGQLRAHELVSCSSEAPAPAADQR